jgi:8-oxo-dGTP diphosphatase
MTDRTTPARAEATLVDRAFQLAYFCAYRGMRLYWKATHPTTNGTLVAMWHRGEVLLVRNSYVPYYSLPGGYMRRDEAPADAVLRELREEVGVTARAEDLELVYDETREWEGKNDHVRIFRLEVPIRPEIRVDHREVIEASWWTPEKARELTLFPPVRAVL